jgi:hypothetical protein
MIKYALACDQGHPFEGWFSVSADYDNQRERDAIECPYCGSREIAKQIMAPAIAGTKAQTRGEPGGIEATPQMRAVMMEAMGKVRAHVEENFDYMGDSFASEARAIHEGRSEERGIYGEATPTEVKSLVEDGVPVAPLPPPAVKKTAVN